MPTQHTATLEEELDAHTDATIRDFYIPSDGKRLPHKTVIQLYLEQRDSIHHKHHARLVEGLWEAVYSVESQALQERWMDLLSQYPDSNQRKEV